MVCRKKHKDTQDDRVSAVYVTQDVCLVMTDSMNVLTKLTATVTSDSLHQNTEAVDTKLA